MMSNCTNLRFSYCNRFTRSIWSSLLCFGLSLAAAQTLSAHDAIVDSWRYTLEQPADGWQQADFDDSTWAEGSGGLGTRGTPGARVGTVWETKQIWLRKTYQLAAIPAEPALLVHHDEDAKIFINGKLVIELPGYVAEYKTLPLDDAAKAALQVGSNVLAVHCRQTGGGQFIDVHLIDAAHPPELPKVRRDPTPFQSELITQWGASVTADNAWTEYPRPQMERSEWQNLNGHWDYSISPRDQQEPPVEWSGKILVPFPLESRLSGVQRLLEDDETLWYHRSFHANPTEGKRTLLNFEAVDYRSRVIINGSVVGEHTGGNTPFAMDITDALRPGENTLIVRVEDDTEAWQLHGKQVLDARGIWYTQVSGIWQTVWMEEVADSHIEDLHITTDATTGSINVKADVAGAQSPTTLRVAVLDGEKQLVSLEADSGATLPAKVSNPKLWSPASPQLYDLQVELLDAQGKVLDSLKSYAGIRSVGKTRDADGHWRFTLNGEVIFHWGPLDQGWWPDGLLTPPSDEGMLFDIQFLKDAGFNMIRKHIKVEPRRYYMHCDRVGMMVWQDQVSAGHNPPWTRMKPDPQDTQWPDEHHQQFMLEFERMIDNLENHPSIVVWTPFNEAWGQHRTMEVGKWAVERDPLRLINIASGGNFWPIGDIADAHDYPNPNFPFEPKRYDDYIKVMGEFGGHGLPVQGHLWDANRRNWGYGSLPKDEAEYKQRYVVSLDMLNNLRHQGIAAGVYTQTTDVEGEINGLMTYDRKVIKIPAAELKQLHERLFSE
jgi:beta-galactosidase/beta-glucuronidase